MVIALFAHGIAHAACTSPAGSEGDVRYDTTDKGFYFCEGAMWLGLCVSRLPATPTDVRVTTASHDGDFGGLGSVRTFIAANGCANHRPCHLEDIQRYSMSQSSAYTPPADAWIAAGQRYTVESILPLLVEPTCGDWTSNSAGLLGAVLRAADGKIGYGDCGDSFPVLCCAF